MPDNTPATPVAPASPFAPRPALDSLADARLADRHRLLIGGRWVDGGAGSRPVLDPATGAPLTEVAAATAAQVDAAVAAARAAQPGWAGLAGAERAKHLFRLARLVQEHARELTLLEAANTGRPAADVKANDVAGAAQLLFHYAGWADKLRHAVPGARVAEPAARGVAALLLPWDAPLLTFARTAGPALAAGNTVVAKPAATTPLSVLRLAEIARRAGLPDGVLNVLTDGAPEGVGPDLAGHAGVDVVSFTGSTAVGRTVAALAARTGARTVLDLGDQAPHLLFDDAPLDEAVEAVVGAAFTGRGRPRGAIGRLLVQEPVLDEVVERLRARIARLRLGAPLDRNADLGPLHSAAQAARVAELVATAGAEGAEVWTAPEHGERLAELRAEGGEYAGGFWQAPVLVTGVTQAHAVAATELRAPVLPVLTFRTPAEGVEKANNTPFGGAAAVWSAKGAQALWAARRLRAGTVWVNEADAVDAAAPHHVGRQSGSGRAGGHHGLEAYLDV
ncbi:aldehyde dehydrogenase family protein [Allostreptomyces psammosilenae]|uniref:Aldehyde dehydrogenase (NAD+) n=1 Tax=Allostreptomyces psammosilenae TaxID=1892865 RepID=A0A853ABQ2_9ACTN|nr:aldehyde dehydrogenase family protein [Allostreptomyces psammosilenae]NYI08021.1 aldehyde dehydrogenase (NAD+) [Allostreptomyces psammosilenae]